MPAIKPATITEYAAAFPKDTQKALQQVRAAIKKAAPGAEETISYGMPAFKLNGRPLIYCAGYKNHVGLYALPKAHAAFKKELASYKQGRGSVQFPLDKPMPLALIAKIVKFRVKENLGKAKTKPTKTIASWMSSSPDYYPKRIVCLTEEPTETLYLLGEQHRIVGISGFTVRPAQARKEKPKVSAFTSANIEKIIALQPDLVIGFSDIQADIARELIAKGITVWINNHRSVEEIYQMMIQLGSLVGKGDAALELTNRLRKHLEQVCKTNQSKKVKPKVYFEEWYDPLITGIRWVSELIELAGGVDIFREHQNGSLAKDRILKDANEVVARNPDIIIASWCCKKFKKEKLVGRKGWNNINAVKNDFAFEMDSSVILQPGPAAVSEGVEQIATIIERWHRA